jgi:hypothetical protein
LDYPDAISRNESRNELLHIALHGDYKYTKLKNTAKELDAQNETFEKRLENYFFDKNLIVIGYSGRDESLMKALKSAFSKEGSGRLYWCGYGEQIPEPVETLIRTVSNSGREAFYVPSDTFDETLVSILKSSYSDDKEKNREIDELMRSSEKASGNKPFTLDTVCSYPILSNLFPIQLPKEVFQFEIKYPCGVNHWQFVKEHISSSRIMAVPFETKVYAFGLSAHICSAFKDYLTQEPIRNPISLQDIQANGSLKKLFVKTILSGIASVSNLRVSYDKSIIWNEKLPYNKYQDIFEAVKITLLFKDGAKYALLSMTPTLYFINKEKYSKEVYINIIHKYTDALRNELYEKTLQKWTNAIFRGNKISFDYPKDSGNGFEFKISGTRGAIDIDYTSVGVIPEEEYKSNNRLYRGILLQEPRLEYMDKITKRSSFDYNPMRGLINNLPYDYVLPEVYRSEVNIGVICPRERSEIFSRFLNGLNGKQETTSKDYVQQYPGFMEAYGCSLQIPPVSSDRWTECHIKQDNTQLLAQKLCEHSERLSSMMTNGVVIIFIPECWSQHRSFRKNGESFDLHNYIKAFAAEHHFTTQIIEENTINNTQMRCEVYWWLSLAIFVKTMRTPWALADLDEETAYAGIGYSIKSTPDGDTSVVLGCSHIYNAKGQGLRYKLSKIENPILEKKNPYLNYDEAYKLGVTIQNLLSQSMCNTPKRVVIHKRTPFKEEEIRGITQALNKANIVDIDLISIEEEHSIKCIDQSAYYGTISTSKYPIKRGMCVLLSESEFLLWTHGCVNSIINKRSYYHGGRGIPIPLRITKWYGNGDVMTIANEILGFTKINWNSFNYYTKLPATIDTSNALAQVGNLLSHYRGVTYDYRYFI